MGRATEAMTSAIRKLLLLAALIGALTAESAVAGPYDVIRDCIDDERLQGDYSDAQLHRALRRLTGDVDEYSNCRAIINAAIGDDPKARESRNGDGKDESEDLDGDGKVTAAERRKARRLARKRARERKRERERERDKIAAVGDPLGGDDSDDDSAGGGGGGSSGVPLPAMLALAALVLGGAGGGTWFAAQRNPTIANALRRAGLPLPQRD